MTLKYIVAKVLKRMRFSAVTQSVIHPTSTVESGSSVTNSTMCRHSFCGYDCEIIYADIGSFVSIANNVVIGASQHPLSWVSTSPAFYRGRDSIAFKAAKHEREAIKRVSIGNDVWIGSRAIILPGVEIGDGAVVGAGSVVTRNVAPYAIVAGVPARHLRHRFSSELMGRLLQSKWWEYSDNELQRCGKYAKSPEKFISCLTSGEEK